MCAYGHTHPHPPVSSCSLLTPAKGLPPRWLPSTISCLFLSVCDPVSLTRASRRSRKLLGNGMLTEAWLPYLTNGYTTQESIPPSSSNRKSLIEPQERVGSHEFPLRNSSLHSHKYVQKEPDSWAGKGCDVHLVYSLDSGHGQWQTRFFRSEALRRHFGSLLKMERKTPYTLLSPVLGTAQITGNTAGAWNPGSRAPTRDQVRLCRQLQTCVPSSLPGGNDHAPATLSYEDFSFSFTTLTHTQHKIWHLKHF